MESHLTRRQFVYGSAAGAVSGFALPRWSTAEDPQGAWSLENQYLKYVIGPDARSLHFIDLQSGRDHCGGDGKLPLARVKKAGRSYDASSAQFNAGRLTLSFGESSVRAVLQATIHPQHIVLEVLSVTGEGVEEFTLVDIPLTLKGSPEEPFSACALALNLRTNVEEIPQPASRLRAMCYPRFGMVGAKVALVAAAQDKLREALQEAVSAAEDLPHSPLGGPWAMDAPINHGSYLFNFGSLTIDVADDWVKLAKTLGMNQIDFHGGKSFRFGDCYPNPVTYPKGIESLKDVIDVLHTGGIAAGLHTYAFFIDKRCPWVTPVPDPRLANDAMFTLAADLPPDALVVPVAESTANMSITIGFGVRNSVTLRIDDELVTYTATSKAAPFAFSGCQRGACGTRASAHARGTKVYHLKECFGLFVPDPETTLFTEVAARTAETFNACGFDMIYLDALDGADILGGSQNRWHYSSRFVYEICERLKKPALMEMSLFHHHLWCVRSRFCAWDYPRRSHKKFIDIHCRANENSRRMFMPGQLGWWALQYWTGAQAEPTFNDDIEYLMAKCLGTDTGFSLIGLYPQTLLDVPAAVQPAAVIRRYEDLRHSGKVPESIKAQLRVPGDEFTLIGDLKKGWQFKPVHYAKHKVESAERWSSRWTTTNKFSTQPLRLRIEAFMAAGPYDAPGNLTLVDFTSPDDFANRLTQLPAVAAADLKPSKDPIKRGATSGCLTATNSSQNRTNAWAKFEKTFTPPQNLNEHQALGLWVHGDGQGEVINVQLKSPWHLAQGYGEHYIVVDFTGWRYFELIEPEGERYALNSQLEKNRDGNFELSKPEGERYADYQWPYGDIYSIYRNSVQFDSVDTLGLWYNNLPPGSPVTCYLSPIKALPLVSAKLINPMLKIGGHTITFPVEIPSGHYLELSSAKDCRLHGPNGEMIRRVMPQGPRRRTLPVLKHGENKVVFQAQTLPGLSLRAKVTIATWGKAIR